MICELTSGACVVMEIKGPMGASTPEEFRKLAGPSNPVSVIIISLLCFIFTISTQFVIFI